MANSVIKKWRTSNLQYCVFKRLQYWLTACRAGVNSVTWMPKSPVQSHTALTEIEFSEQGRQKSPSTLCWNTVVISDQFQGRHKHTETQPEERQKSGRQKYSRRGTEDVQSRKIQRLQGERGKKTHKSCL